MVDIQQTGLTGIIAGDESADTIIATTDGMVDVTLDAQAGDDIITGTNINADGVGILSSAIDAGAGNDTITGAGTGDNGIGMVDTGVYGGEGDDLFVASGTNSGIQGTALVGGAGNDIFNVQRGTGVIVGELGTDRLVLEGSRADYTFTPIDEIETVIRVDGVSNGTAIITAQLEQFQFAAEPDIIVPVDEFFI